MRKLGKWLAFIIALAMIVTSLSYIVILPGMFGAQSYTVYGAEQGALSDEAKVNRELVFLKQLMIDIQKNFKDKVTYEQLMEGAYEGVFEALDDPYSEYYADAKEGEDFVTTVSGTFCGIGVGLIRDGRVIRIESVIPGGPAESAGIKVGDVLTKVEGVSFEEKDVQDAVQLLRGEKGTKVSLSVERNQTPLHFTLTRAELHQTAVSSQLMENRIGYIKITGFDDDTDSEFRAARLSLLAQGAKSFIIDVRDNPGGLIDTAVGIAKQLMPKGPILHFSQQGKIVETVLAPGADGPKLPTVLLINGGSASSSEILAGALKDSKTAQLVGTTTFGKGVAQKVSDLANGQTMKLSHYYFLTPDKNTIDGKGVSPDFTVENGDREKAEALLKTYQSFAPMSEKTKPVQGQTGLNVYGAQQRLNFMGYVVSVTGTMDEKTVTAVKQFQKEQGLSPYGGLDYSTMGALEKQALGYILDVEEGTEDLQLAKAVSLLTKGSQTPL